MFVRNRIEALAERLARYEASGEATEVLDPELLHWAAEILLGSGPAVLDVALHGDEHQLFALVVVGTLHHYRFLELPEQDCQPDLMAACALFMLLPPHLPDAVPDELREFIDGPEWNLPRDGTAAWAEVSVVHLAFGQIRRDLRALDDAAALAAQALATAPAGHPMRWAMHYRAGHALLMRSDHESDPAAARAAMRHTQAALACDPPTDMAPLVQADLRRAWLAVVASTHDLDAVGEVLRGARLALAGLADDHPDHSRVLRCLWAGHARRYELGQDIDDLRAAVQVSREIVASSRRIGGPEGTDLQDADLALHLAQFLLKLHEHDREPAYLDEAIDRLQVVLAAMPKTHRLWPDFIWTMAFARIFLYGVVPTTEMRDAAIEAAERCLAIAGGSSVDRAAVGGLRAGLLRDRAIERGDPHDGADSLSELSRSLAELPEAHALRPQLQAALGLCLYDRFRSTRQHDDLALAERLLRDTCQRLPPRSGGAGRVLNTLGLIVTDLGQLAGDVAMLREAADLQREALASEGHQLDRLTWLASLSMAQYQIALYTGESADFDTSIEMVRQTIAGLRPNTVPWAAHHSVLSELLNDRYRRWGGMADLEEAIQCLDKAVATMPLQHGDRRNYLSRLGRLLMMRSVRLVQPEDLARAITCHRLALETLDPDEANDMLFFHLGMALGMLYLQTGEQAVLQEAITHVRAAIGRVEPTWAERATYRTALANLLTYAVVESGDLSSLDEIVALCRRAAEELPLGYPSRGAQLLSSAKILVAAERLRNSPEPRYAEAVNHLRWAVEAPGGPVSVRLEAATWWARMAPYTDREDVAEVYEAYQEAVRLLPRVAWQGIHRSDQLHQLAQHAGLAREAVQFAIMAERPSEAVELAELGRGVLSGQTLQLRIDLASLREDRPDLARRMTDLATVLDDVGLSTMEVADQRSLDERGRAAREWEQVFAEARAVLGEEALMLVDRPSFAHLAGLLPDPVVLINIAPVVNHALLIRPGAVEPVVVELPELREEDVDRAVRALRGSDRGRGSRDLSPPAPTHAALASTLDWLWRAIAEPVLAALGAHAPVRPGAEWPRLVWCPTGNLTRLPLHAARPLSGGDGVLDRVVSSYTTTIKALCQPGSTGNDGSLLVIAVPQAAGLAELPAVLTEAEALRTTLTRVEALIGDAAKPDAVQAAMAKQSNVHFACHGGWSAAGSGTLRLALSGGDLTPLDLARIRSGRAGFAYLSACDTMIGPADAADEGLHMAGALQLVGFRHVVATLWTINDATAAAVAVDVYRRMALPTRELAPHLAAFALHDAVRALRDRDPDAITAWAPYIHLGGIS